MSNVFEEQAIRFLRGEENPFDANVVPDRPACEFRQRHVPEVHDQEFQQICCAIDKYRCPDYRTRHQLHETRVLLIQGRRGSGKTHLLHALRQRPTPAPEIWVCPRYYDPGFPFAEYLLTELVRTLLSSEDAESPERLRWCARELGRRLLGQALGAIGPHLWPQWAGLGGAACAVWSPGGRKRWSDYEGLCDRLADGQERRPLADLCAEYGLSPTAAWALTIWHIEQSEQGTGAAARMRREVLLAFAELAFRRQPSRLERLLEQDFVLPGTALPPARAEVVLMLLQSLTEVLVAIQVPLVFGFDNMERLLAPKGPVDLPMAQGFFNGLAHLVDQTRGLLAILFVEHGEWMEFGQAISAFVQHRLWQGVRVRDYGSVWRLELKPPTPDQIERVVVRRMEPLLKRAPGGQDLPPCFPFAPQEVGQIATAGADVLRTALLRLRDRYDELVLPQEQQAGFAAEAAAPAAADTAAALADALQQDWEQAAASGRQRLQMSRRTSLAPELHTGLGRWLELLVGQVVQGWKLVQVKSAVTYGDHPTFGVVTLAAWHDQDGRSCRVALGPLLGEGSSMPKDLEIKLTVLSQRPPLAEQLVVLRPLPQGTTDAKQLPAATQRVWDQAATGRPVSVCGLPLTDFAWLLGFPEWLASHVAEGSAAELQNFVLQRTGYLLADLAPRPTPEETP